MNSDTTTRANKGKTSAKRNSEARRRQNRLASRNYREKRKRKLALLDELLEPRDMSGIPTNVSDSREANAGLDHSGPNDILASQSQGQPSASIPTTDSLMSLSLDQGLGNFDNTGTHLTPDTWGNLSQTTTPIFTNPEFPVSLSFTQIGDTYRPATSNSWEGNAFIHTQQLLQVPGDISTTNYATPKIIEEIGGDSPESGHSSNDDGTALNSVLRGVENLTLAQKRSLLRRLQQETSPSTPYPPQQSTPGQLGAIRFATALWNTAHTRPSLLPTQYTMEAGIFGAIFANCYALGMNSVDEILYEEGCSVFSVTPDQGHHSSQLPLVRSRFRTLSPDIQPIDAQVTFGHHPYVDVIPFKTFRENLMAVLMHDPPLIDEGTLCHDILAGGFTCWGSGQNPRGMGAGVPWDARSWEPSTWFLVKYPQLAGGWDEEMWKSARWWHSARGERIQTAQAFEAIDRAFQGATRR
ncbi:hypothetical protein F66182_7410 [Fusarium sp. NRRL 66182]|nr:hypothetical protein F66182_7410 [Fusarium sp. NRRL 66182]